MSKNNYDVFSLPELLSNGEINLRDALDLIATEAILYPCKFGIRENIKEYSSDLYFAIRRNGYFIFDHYKNEYGSFKTYLTSFIKFQIKEIKRNFYKIYAKQKIFEHDEETEYESSKERYEKNEIEYKIAHFKPYNLEKNECAPFSRETPDILDFFRKTKQTVKKLTLVLALKSCFYLTEENIIEISQYCQIDFKKFAKIIESLKKTLDFKQKKYEQILERRDFSYYMHRKYYDKIIEQKEENISDEETKRLYTFHTERWLNKNNFLQNRSYKVCPTNKAIADILGICERQVGYYINSADKLLENQKKKKGKKLYETENQRESRNVD